MGFDIVSAFYLNSSAVQTAFMSRPPPAGYPARPRRVGSTRDRTDGTQEPQAAHTAPDPLLADDLDLLRRFEPQVRYNEGELFLPAAVDGYLAECDLLVGRSERDRRCSCRSAS